MDIVQLDETVDPEKQKFIEDKAMKDETKDIVVEGKEENRKEKREGEKVMPVRDENQEEKGEGVAKTQISPITENSEPDRWCHHYFYQSLLKYHHHH